MLRPHQWTKNLLVFVPILTGHQLTNSTKLTQSSLAFLAMCLMASAVYILNDLIDLKADQAHSKKRHRPLASGRVSKSLALGIMIVFLFSSLGIGFSLSKESLLILGSYFVLNIFYSFWLKRELLVDLFLLTFFYLIRLLLGGSAADQAVSDWLFGFATFFFFGLACLKRFIELRKETAISTQSSRRAYLVEDVPMLMAAGTACSLLSVVVFGLYITAEETRALYQSPRVLWGIWAIFLYWNCRIWFLGNRNEVHDDPVMFAVKDPKSWLLAAGAVIMIWLGS